MPKKSLACLILGLLLVSLLWGQVPPDKKPEIPAVKAAEKPTIDPATQRLIDQLADLDFRKRDEAARLLEAMGEKALPAPRPARKHSDPEVRRRAADLQAPIESATLLAPKRLTLTLEQKTIAEALEAIGKQTGYAIDLTPGPAVKGQPEERSDYKWKDVLFWQALDEVCRAGGLTVQQSFGDSRLRLQAHDRYAPYLCPAGAFCMAAGGFQQTKTVDFSSFPRSNAEVARWDELVFAFYVHAEPRLPLLSLGEPHVTAAYDDENNSMIPPAGAARDQPNPQLFGYRNGRYYYGGNRMLTLTGQLNLVRPSPKAASLKQLKGTLPLTILAEQKSVVVSDNLTASKGKKHQAGTTTFTIVDVSETAGKQVQLQLLIAEEAALGNGPNDFTWLNSMWSRLEVYDDKGNRMAHQGGGMGINGPNQANMSMTYPAGSKPTKLVYQVWTLLHCQIDFEFKGLPLP